MPAINNHHGVTPKSGASLRSSGPTDAKSAVLEFPDDADDILTGLGLHRQPVSVTAENNDLSDDDNDSASEIASTVSSRTSRGGRRRRRNRKSAGNAVNAVNAANNLPSTIVMESTGNNNAGATTTTTKGKKKKKGLKAVTPIPKMAESKPVRLQIGLNLDVELELKAKIQGDISLTLLAERKRTDRACPEVNPDPDTGIVDNELFFMRLGVLRLRRRWLDRDVSPSLTGAIAAALVAGGFVAGFLCSSLLEALTGGVAWQEMAV